MMRRSLLLAGSLIPLFTSPAHMVVSSVPMQDACGALARWSPPVRSKIVLTRIVPTDQEKGAPSYCEVQMTISPVDGSSIGAVYRLPEKWNGKVLGIGGGGAAGNVTVQAAAPALSRGYAVIQNDLGHAGTSSTDWSFAIKAPGQPDAEAIIDFGHRATHVATVVGKAVASRFYGRAPQRAYFQGCSTGGRQGLAEVQRYPEDYDGVIAGAPVHASRYFSTVALRVQTFHKQPGSNLLPAHATLIQNAVLAACDAKDGVTDGVLSDPRTCAWDPRTLQCRGAASPRCLTRAQVQTVRQIYSGTKTRDGRFAMIPLLRGSESDWESRMIGTSQMPRGLNALLGAPFVAFVVKHDPAYDVMTFDPGRDIAAIQNSLAQHVVQENADISAFLGRGGKLLLWHGFNDPGPSPLTTIEYFEDVQKKVPASKEGVRLFLAPGVLHCQRSGGGPERFDTLAALEQWVENGVPPASMIATTANGGLSRPLCPYPQLAKYKGRGSPNDAASFECAAGSRRR